MHAFNYSIRLSNRARHARIVVRPDLTVEVVLPKDLAQGVADSRAALLVREKRAWVERSLTKFRTELDNCRPLDHSFPPRTIELELLQKSLPLVCQNRPSSQVRVRERTDGLYLSGAIDEKSKVSSSLQRWLKLKGREVLLPMLASVAEAHGIVYQKASIRLQRSRWGSCSKAGNISLNAKLLFMPEPLVRYVMIHELAHLEQMNHSAAFWRVVERCDIDFRAHRTSLRRIGHRIPGWVEAV